MPADRTGAAKLRARSLSGVEAERSVRRMTIAIAAAALAAVVALVVALVLAATG
ncbi:MAG TPA: hypothetical protein VFD90_02725 [Gaiellales bacterium]|jgi:hypothetical protein|nr:hypothetical protein [Gaiellales bacterium]